MDLELVSNIDKTVVGLRKCQKELEIRADKLKNYFPKLKLAKIKENKLNKKYNRVLSMISMLWIVSNNIEKQIYPLQRKNYVIVFPQPHANMVFSSKKKAEKYKEKILERFPKTRPESLKYYKVFIDKD